MPSQQADDSTAYVLSPARCPSSTPNNANPQAFHNSPINAHHNTTLSSSAGDVTPRAFHGELPRGMVPAVPFAVDVKDQISDLPGAVAFPPLCELESATPKKKRRRRKKAESATGDAPVMSSCGATMSSGSDHELNPPLFMSQFPGSNLPLGLLLFVQLDGWKSSRWLMLPVAVDALLINTLLLVSFPHFSNCPIQNHLLYEITRL
jgi:hypothetical protein